MKTDGFDFNNIKEEMNTEWGTHCTIDFQKSKIASSCAHIETQYLQVLYSNLNTLNPVLQYYTTTHCTETATNTV